MVDVIEALTRAQLRELDPDVLDAPGRLVEQKLAGKDAGLAGKQLNGDDVCDGLYAAGWRDAVGLWEAAATYASESLWFTQAFHHNIDTTGAIVSTDWGPCQLNDLYHKEFFPNGDPLAIACNPSKCWAAARSIFEGNGHSLDPWYGHKNLVYLDDYYLRRGAMAVMNMIARTAVAQAKGRPPVVAGRTTPATTTRVPMFSTHDLRRIYP
jgi:hypothetical protein